MSVESYQFSLVLNTLHPFQRVSLGQIMSYGVAQGGYARQATVILRLVHFNCSSQAVMGKFTPTSGSDGIDGILPVLPLLRVHLGGKSKIMGVSHNYTALAGEDAFCLVNSMSTMQASDYFDVYLDDKSASYREFGGLGSTADVDAPGFDWNTIGSFWARLHPAYTLIFHPSSIVTATGNFIDSLFRAVCSVGADDESSPGDFQGQNPFLRITFRPPGEGNAPLGSLALNNSARIQTREAALDLTPQSAFDPLTSFVDIGFIRQKSVPTNVPFPVGAGSNAVILSRYRIGMALYSWGEMQGPTDNPLNPLISILATRFNASLDDAQSRTPLPLYFSWSPRMRTGATSISLLFDVRIA